MKPIEPCIIQGGMGIAVSNWKLARSVAQAGQLGVVSGTALALVLAERLKQGDEGGHLRMAMAQFPNTGIVEEVMARYFLAPNEIRAPDKPDPTPPYPIPMYSLPPDPHLTRLTVVANFCEVTLAKLDHAGLIGINYLEKVQLPHLPSLYGAMLAGVDYVLMGAGVPKDIPAVLDKLSQHQPVSLKLSVEGASSTDDYRLTFNPAEILPAPSAPLKRPKFIAIVSSDTLATSLARKSSGKVDGFVVEYPCAGGHNAPPRGSLQLDETGEPVYGSRDKVDLEKIKSLGLPFWLAGGWGKPGRLALALELGAAGIQVGTAFAFCRESGLTENLKDAIIQSVLDGRSPQVYTDPVASPTGFPFKVVRLEKTLSEREIYEKRPRLCQLGLLRKTYKRKDGTLGYRCSGEPIAAYVAKGGKTEDTVGRKCLCNALMANVGFPQRQPSGYVELPLVTANHDLSQLKWFLAPGESSYSAQELVHRLIAPVRPVQEIPH